MTREEKIRNQIRELTLANLQSSRYQGREKTLQLYYEIGLLTAILARLAADDTAAQRTIWRILDPE